MLKEKSIKMEQNKKYRKWCWTDFELDEDFYDTLRSPKWRYLLRGNEVCSTTGKKHWQCYGISSSPKGGARQFLAKNIWITCPVHPMEVYGTREDVNQLLRRIDIIECFNLEQRLNGTKVGGNTMSKLIGTPTVLSQVPWVLSMNLVGSLRPHWIRGG